MGQINLIKTILGNGDPKKPRLPVHPLEKNPDVLPSVEPQARPLQLQQQPIQQPVEAAPQTAPQGLVEQDPYESAKKDYETAVAAKAEKQPLWKQVLFMGLQAVQQIATERPQPYQLLGNAKKNYAVQQAAGRYIPLEQRRQDDQKYRKGQADIAVAEQRPAIAQQTADARTVGAITSARRAEIAAQTQNWREGDRVKYWEWEGVKQKAREERDDRTYEIAIRRQDEIERRNKATEEDADLNRQSREKIAGSQEAGRNSRAGAVTERAKAKLSQMDTKAKSDAINRAVDRWIQNNKKATPAQIADVRKQLQDTYQ